MTEKRKISVRKVLQFSVTIIVAAGCIVAVANASKVDAGKFIKDIDIQVKNENKCHFIDKDEVLNLLVNNRHLDIKHIPAGQLDLHGMEQIVSANPWVDNAEIYVDNAHNLHINVTQRVPVARVFEEDGNSYYLDTALRTMPLSDRYIYYTTVVTNAPVMKDDSAAKSWKAQIVHVVRFIEKDIFWNAQVSQIIMTPEHTFELVPVLGHQRILVGDTSRLQEKFANLYAFYKSVLNRIGWDKYEVIDIRYEGQVVATPSLPWNAPVDKAMSNMNWVKSIVGNDDSNKSVNVNKPPAAIPPGMVVTPKKPEVKPAVVVAKPAVQVAKPAVQVAKPPVQVAKPPVQVAKAPAKKEEKPAVKVVAHPSAPKALPAAANPKAKPIKVEKVAVKPAAVPVKGPPKPTPTEDKTPKAVAKPTPPPVKGPPKPDDLDEKKVVKEEAHPPPKMLMPAAAKKEVKAAPVKKAPVKVEKKEVKKDVKAKKPEPKTPVKKEAIKK